MPRFARNDGCEVTGLPRFPSVARNGEKRGKARLRVGTRGRFLSGGRKEVGTRVRFLSGSWQEVGTGCDFYREGGKGEGREGMGSRMFVSVVCNRGIGEGNQIFYLFILPEKNGEAKMVCDMARNENGGLLRMEGSGGIRSGGQGGEIQGVRDQARS